MVFDVFLKNVVRFQKVAKNYVRLQDDEISGHTIKSAGALHLKKNTLTWAVRDIYRIATKIFLQT